MKRLLVLILVAMSTLQFIVAQSDLQPLVTIKLNKTESITLKQLKDRVATYEKQTGQANFTVEQRRQILDSMIDEKLVVQAATQAGINITDSMVDEAFLQSISAQVGTSITEQQFAEIIRAQSGLSLDEYFEAQVGMDLNDYKEYFKSQLIAQQYVLATKQAELQQNSVVTDSEIRSFFEINKSSFVQNDILKLFLVVVPKGNDTNAAKKQAEELHKDLKSNKVTFDELRLQMRQPGIGFQAGDMFLSKGTLAAQQLGMDYETLLDLFTRNVGHFDDVQETQTTFQFYVIQDKYSAKLLNLDDVVQPDSTVTVYEYIRAQLTQEKQAKVFAAIVTEVTQSLRTSENYQMLKTDSALNSLLNW